MLSIVLSSLPIDTPKIIIGSIVICNWQKYWLMIFSSHLGNSHIQNYLFHQIQFLNINHDLKVKCSKYWPIHSVTSITDSDEVSSKKYWRVNNTTKKIFLLHYQIIMFITWHNYHKNRYVSHRTIVNHWSTIWYW